MNGSTFLALFTEYRPDKEIGNIKGTFNELNVLSCLGAALLGWGLLTLSLEIPLPYAHYFNYQKHLLLYM